MQVNPLLSDNDLLRELRSRLEEKTRYLNRQDALITELRLLNERLREAEQVKSGFLSNIRNEVNNPLTSIIGLSEELIQSGKTSAQKVTWLAGIIKREALSLDFQMRNIFIAAEIEAGEINPSPALMSITDLLDRQELYFRQKAELTGVTIHHEHHSGESVFVSDPFLLQAIIMNLLSNAVNFSKPGGEVKLSSAVADDMLTMTVHDNGVGISEESFRHIFERFRQVEQGSTKRYQGHGLGLSIVKELADLLGGELDIQSVQGESTTCTVSLPAIKTDIASKDIATGTETLFSDIEMF